MDNENYDQSEFDSRILSSSHLNFLLGAGINGKAVYQMKGMHKTHKLFIEKAGHPMEHFEKDLLDLSETDCSEVLNMFKIESEESINNVDYAHNDIQDQKRMFNSFNHLLLSFENRIKTMKQENIYTTNYNSIVANILNKSGYLCNSISSSNLESNDKFFDMIGCDYEKSVFVPTYLVSKRRTI